MTGAELVFCLALTGCGRSDGVQRIPLAGKVTFQGKPVEEGQIRFVPMAGWSGPITIEVVNGGWYNTATSGGVPVGRHRVEIRAYNPNELAPTGPGVPARTQLLPAKYNTQSELEIALESGQSRTTRDFELTH